EDGRAPATTLIEALRRPLAFAARDDFAALGRIVGLGVAAAAAAGRILPLLGSAHGPVRAELTKFANACLEADAAPEAQRRVIVARGLRLCARLADLLGQSNREAGRRGGTPGLGCAEGPRGRSTPASTPPTRSPMDLPSPAPARPNPDPLPVSPSPCSIPPAPPAAGLAAALTSLPGCGPAFAARFAAGRGVECVGDLLWLLPLGYEDRRAVVPLAQLADVPDGSRVTTRGTVRRVSSFPRRFVDLTVEDEGVRLVARWFRVNPGLAKRFTSGDQVVLSGALKRYQDQLMMAHPDVVADEGAGGGIRVRYPEVEAVPPRIVARLCRAACVEAADLCPDGLPAELTRRLELPSLAAALRTLHLVPADLPPADVAALDAGQTAAHRRLVFDELFFLQLGLARRRARWRADAAPALPAIADPLAEVRPHLGFAPTAAQERAAREIAAELCVAEPMNRLLQGDVGAGKTVVAFAAALQMARAGWQTALMAPTEILAEQHLATITPWARALGLRTALLTASTPRGARESLLALTAAGRLDIVIGTHALLAERVGFDRLGLVIVDEQHRFGVAQRARLRRKGEGAAGLPHLLVMTATPIPRTLALTIYGDLDVTTLDELPPGRRPPATTLHLGARGRREARARLQAELAAGRQAFVVCPRVEEPDDPDTEVTVKGAVGTAERLAAELPGARVGLVHGRLPAPERDEAMRRFRAGDFNLLVATTVIEVGVDIPRATMMVVLSADRFGLAQLHQLRGRIGRGGGESACLLVCEPEAGEEAIARLRVLCDTGDGFRIAEADLALRGPGELAGTRQAGMPRLRFGDLARHGEVLRLARTEAFALALRDPELKAPEHAAAKAVLESRWDPAALYGEEAG
ncbi:MAG TPA: ATP-dependent DNA helicase RecG, partial [Polyangia bacterium]